MGIDLKKSRKFCSVFIIFLMVFELAANFNLYNVKALEGVSAKRGVNIDKVWSIKFNQEISRSTSNLKKVKIYDELYNLIETNSTVSEDGKELKVKALENYKVGSKYYLYIDKGFQAIDGQVFGNEIKMEFETIRKLPADLTMDKSKDNRFTIGIDAGQMFQDYVKYEDGTLAKEINLNVAMKVGKFLESSGAKVVYTREGNTVGWTQENDVDNRVRINENGQTDLLLSIYCNTYDKASVEGIETYYLKGREEEKKIAEIIHSNLIKDTKANDRGVKTKEQFPLFEQTNSPAVMVDLGFLSNKDEGNLLIQKSYQDKIAKSIAQSIIKHVGRDKIEERNEIKVKDMYDEVKIGEDYSLPNFITARLKDGTKEKRIIDWKRISIDTSKEGTYFSYGRVDGYSGIIVMNLEVKNQETDGNTDNKGGGTGTGSDKENGTENTDKEDNTDKEEGNEGNTDKEDNTDKEEGNEGNTDKEDNTDKEEGNEGNTDKEDNTDKEEGNEGNTDKEDNTDKEEGNEGNTDKEDNTDKEYKYIVALNPSRGGQDEGTTGITGLEEKELNLEIAKKAGAILEKEGIQVIYTRTSDEDVYKSSDWTLMKEIEARVNKAENAGAQLMVSIGGNSYEDEASKGIETFYNESDNKSKKLAKFVQDNLIQETAAKYRGYKEVDYLKTLKSAEIPSAWAAIGFLTNKEEEANLKDEDYKDKIAIAIANGIKEYLEGTDYTEFEYITKEINQGDEFKLPKTIGVRNSNGEVRVASISWDNDKVDTRHKGVYTYKGKVEGTNKILTYTIIVNQNGDGHAEHTVLLDPGHGGYDSGGIGPSRTREKDITLSVSLKVGDYLVRNGIDVKYTRTSDKVSWPSNERKDLEARVKMSNDMKPDIFVSIHCNKFYKESVNGIETFYFENSSNGKKLAELVQSNLITNTELYNRKVKVTDMLYVLKYTDAPAILTEIGFLSNNYEEKLLSSEEGQDKIAKAVAKGILNYFGIYDINLD